MRKAPWMALVLLLAALSVGVQALPTNEVWDTYYDCALNENGWRILTCGGGIYTSGTLSGAYRLREWTNCNTGAYSYQWYYWNGSGWTAFSGPPGPNC